MTVFRGESGSIHFDAGAGDSLAAIGSTRSWTFTATKETIDTTVQGNTSRSFIGSLISGTGSAEIVYENGAGTSKLNAFISDALTANDNADAEIELFISGSTHDRQSLNFSAVITDFEVTSTTAEIVTANVSFISTGDINYKLADL